MEKKLFLAASFLVLASIFVACSSNGVSSSDVNNLVAGPNSIKGTITGTMQDNTPFNFTYDYHVTTNDGNSYSESWIENDGSTYAGDTVLWFEQYFYVDRNGYNDYGDRWSPSGRYLYLEAYINIAKMQLMPADYSGSDPYLEGMWQNTTTSGNRFVYATYYNNNQNSGSLDLTSLKYDKNSQILSGKLNMALPDNHTQNNWFGNKKATSVTGDFKIYIPKEAFLVSKKSDNNGIVYRKRGK